MNDADWQAFLDQVLALRSVSFVEGGVVFVFMDWRSIYRLYPTYWPDIPDPASHR